MPRARHEYFHGQNAVPNDGMLVAALGNAYSLWRKVSDYVIASYPSAKSEWNFPGQKYGWSFRIKDKRRAIIYLLPREAFFQVAFVFGQKATDVILKSDVSEKIKSELKAARVYGEGRGIRIDVRNASALNDIKFLVDTKLKN